MGGGGGWRGGLRNEGGFKKGGGDPPGVGLGEGGGPGRGGGGGDGIRSRGREHLHTEQTMWPAHWLRAWNVGAALTQGAEAGWAEEVRLSKWVGMAWF